MPRVADNKIYSQASSEFWVSWIAAIIWNAITWVAIIKGGENLLQAFDESPVFYFFVLFPFIGLFTIYSAIKQTLAWLKFGKTPVVLNPAIGQVGGYCAGSITLPILTQEAAVAELSLSCKRRYFKKDSDGHSSTHDEVIWHDQVSLKPERYGRKKIQINFSFLPPIGLPISEEKSDNYHLWELHIKVPVRGIDYDRMFELPMQAASESISGVAEFSRTQTSEVIEHKETDKGLIPTIKKTSAGTEFYYGYGRSKVMAMAIMLFGLFLGGFSYLFFGEFTAFLPITSSLINIYVSLIAAGLFLLSLFLVLNSLTVEVSLSGIRKQQKILGFKLEEFIKTENIADISVKQNASSTSGKNTRVWYALKLLTNEGQAIEVADSLEGQSYANEIKQTMLDSLGSRWKVRLPEQLEQKSKRPLPRWAKWAGKLLSYSFSIALLYDLSQFFPELTEIFQQLKF